MKMERTYYVNAGRRNRLPRSLSDCAPSDLMCLAALFVTWVGLFVRYGFGLQPIVYVVLFSLLMAETLADRFLPSVPWIFPAAFTVVWAVSLWFIPYGIGPAATAAGGGGLTGVFAGLWGMGVVPMLLDGLIAAIVAAILVFVAMIICANMSSEEIHLSSFLVLASLALLLGLKGCLVTGLVALAVRIVIALVRHFTAAYNRDPMTLLMAGQAAGNAGNGKRVAILSFTLATYITFLFL